MLDSAMVPTSWSPSRPVRTSGRKAPAQLARIPGVRTVEPLQHRFAYIGSDLQDLYGVDPATIVKNAQLRGQLLQGRHGEEAVRDARRQTRRDSRQPGGRDRLPAAARRPSQPAPEGPTHPKADPRPLHVRRHRARVPDRAARQLLRRELLVRRQSHRFGCRGNVSDPNRPFAARPHREARVPPRSVSARRYATSLPRAATSPAASPRSR